jgi:hypothetical protein
MEAEGLIYFLRVQAAVAEQFSGKQEHRYLVPVARPCRRFLIDVDDIDGDPLGARQLAKFAQHFLA